MTNKNINLSVVVPVFNEEKTLVEILNQLKLLKDFCNLEIIIVNDGSSDKSKEIIINNDNLYSKAIHFEKNMGKGKAVIEGLKLCSGECALIQDADLEYSPNDIVKFFTTKHRCKRSIVYQDVYIIFFGNI